MDVVQPISYTRLEHVLASDFATVRNLLFFVYIQFNILFLSHRKLYMEGSLDFLAAKLAIEPPEPEQLQEKGGNEEENRWTKIAD